MLRHVRSSEGWNYRSRETKGFTLIELLVVIIILGILAAVVVLAINGIQDRGEENACKTEKKTIESAAAVYYAENDSQWPSSSEQLLGTDPPLIRDNAYNWTISTTNGEATATGKVSGTPVEGVLEACNA